MKIQKQIDAIFKHVRDVYFPQLGQGRPQRDRRFRWKCLLLPQVRRPIVVDWAGRAVYLKSFPTKDREIFMIRVIVETQFSFGAIHNKQERLAAVATRMISMGQIEKGLKLWGIVQQMERDGGWI